MRGPDDEGETGLERTRADYAIVVMQATLSTRILEALHFVSRPMAMRSTVVLRGSQNTTAG